MFGVLATGFSVLLGFVVFLAFTSYDQSRAGAETEALVGKADGNRPVLPRGRGTELTGELICYGRSVVDGEWERMREGTLGDAVNVWGVRLFDTLRTVSPETAAEQSAFDRWLDQTGTREEARQDRIHGAVGVIPTPLWIVLFFVAGVIFVYMLFFASSGERAVVQGFLAGSVASVVTAMLLLLGFLEHPFHEGVGGLQPTAMERTLRQLDVALREAGVEVRLPCNAAGIPEAS